MNFLNSLKKLKAYQIIKPLVAIGVVIVLFLAYDKMMLYAKSLSREELVQVSEEGKASFDEYGLSLSDFVDESDFFVDADNMSEVEAAEEEEIIEIKAEQKNSVSEYDKWKLILVNKQNAVPEDYNAELIDIGGGMKVDKRIASALGDMLNAAKDEGVSLTICSAYRSYDRQTTLFNNHIRKQMSSGKSYLEAYREASYSVTVPGTSEHQLGMALDIVTPSFMSLTEGFADTEAGKWLREHSDEYGFILRYPKGKENITGIIYEPWHFRYVGKRYAKEITESGLCLEEYLESVGLK